MENSVSRKAVNYHVHHQRADSRFVEHWYVPVAFYGNSSQHTAMSDKEIIIKTSRLQLREFVLEDAAFLLSLMNSPGYVRYIGDRNLRCTADAQDYIAERIAPPYQQDGYGMWLVQEAIDAKPVGTCGLVNREFMDDVDLGYAFLPEASGLGYATEAAAAVLDYASRNLGFDRVVAITALENPGSIRVLEKLGYRFSRIISFPGDDEGARLFEPT